MSEHDVHQRTPLHVAAARGGGEGMVKALLNSGADPMIRNAHGETAIDIAKNKRNIKAAELMNEHVKQQSIHRNVDQLVDKDDENDEKCEEKDVVGECEPVLKNKVDPEPSQKKKVEPQVFVLFCISKSKCHSCFRFLCRRFLCH